MTERLRCIVPGCGRTRAPIEGCTEWICAKHWTTVERGYRATYLRLRRKCRKIWAAGGSVDEWDWRRASRFWEACKRQAIERAMGI